MSLELLLVVAFAGPLFTYILGKLLPRLREGCALLSALLPVIITACLYGRTTDTPLGISFLGLPIVLRINMLSWFFAMTIVAIGLLSILYSVAYMKQQRRLDYYYFTMLFINASMLGTVISGDFLSFFIFWEMMSWSTYLLISYRGGRALFAGIKYIVMSLIGSLAMLLALISLYVTFGTLEIAALADLMQTASINYILFILILFSITFIIINAFWPLHTWLPDAHAEAVSPFSSVLSAVLVRKGMYGLYLFMYVILGFNILDQLKVSVFSFNGALCWLGAITIIFAAFTALLQNDSKRILAWSTVGQGGYMLLGVAFISPLGMAGGTFHVLNHCIYIGLLFFVAGAIEYRTGGVRDLNELGGLIKKMPVTFVGGLVGICGLIGMPLTNGFVSKWLIYKTLILNGRPFLAFAAFIGTWGTILYGYKFIHNIFLGQLPEKYKDIKEVPFSMQLPIFALTILVFVFGILPGIALKVVNAIGIELGFESFAVTTWGITSETGTLNVISIFAAVFIFALIVWLVLKAGPKAVAVSQEDSYAAGAAIPEGKYHYTVNFYNPMARIIAPFVKDFVDIFYMKLAGWTRALCDVVRRFYTGYVGHYLMYIVLFVAVLIFIQIKWSPW